MLGTTGALATFSPQLQEHAKNIVEKRKIKKEEEIQKTPKMTGKKRFRGKTESTNVKTPKGRVRGHRKINIKNDKVKKKRLLF